LATVSNTLPGDLFRGTVAACAKAPASVQVFNLLQDGIGIPDTPATAQKWLRCASFTLDV